MANEITPYITAAVSAYGTAVLTRTTDASADATVSLGQRILQRIWRREDCRPDLEQAVKDASEAPDDEDFQARLRAQIKRILRDDRALVTELTGMLVEARVTLAASGERAVVAKDNSGVISTGDNATIQR
ncbi:hypothetical protein OG266_25460 [Streptomyces sp. NBC_00554]|uniref:hypothetical protein n=1 Tax=Streptomyces sp. NBC_00554 TaxID=2903661 RepID=UPI00352C06EE|nr:hypothetical protein OG266_25460 [Streptomyces sp. NBC_00554]